ncbi:MAG: putative ATP-dependent helicase [Acidimicrobiaceae bacterium]|nr:putative ATP-dependent helicase [Acidimicrobiaceae bacterium]
MRAGADAPAPWRGCERIAVDESDLVDPARAIGLLHQAWSQRLPVVVALGVEADRLRAEESDPRPAFELGPEFAFDRERLHFLVWANTYDARAAEPVWWHARKAVRKWSHLGVQPSERADIVLGDGSHAYVDGGPAFAPPLADGSQVVHRWSAELGPLAPVRHGQASATLAPDQLAAVSHVAGPARVIAPAGSGKTRVLTERLRHLVVDLGAPPGAVTALAFNTLAAEELRSRSTGSPAATSPHIRTINSLGLWICNELGSSGRLRLAGQLEVREIVQHLFEVRRQTNADPVAPYIEALSAIRLGLVPPAQAEEAFPDASGVAAGFESYRQALAYAGALDFDEQVYRAVEILLRDPRARRRAAERCRWLLVDEFQDLHPAHLLLVRLLSAPGYNCFAVGDDDQVLYGYSGATPEFLIHYSRLFPGAREHALEVNYRCPPDLVTAASTLLSYNERRVPKAIRAAGSPGADASGGVDAPPSADRPGLVVRQVVGEELARAAVATVAAWIDEGVPLGDVAILARVNSALLPVQVALTESGTPCAAPLTASVLERTGMRTALAYLRIGCDPAGIARADLLETIRRPSRGIAPNVVETLTKARRTSVADITRLAGRLSGRDVAKLDSYAADLAAVAEACKKSSGAALRAVRTRIGLGETMDVLDASRGQADRSTHADDLVALESVAALHRDAATFEAWLRSTLDREQPSGPSVLLSTVHRVKGREWGHVVVYGVSRGSWPHRLSDDEEGERRVLHVALTRARSQAVVLADSDAPSSFLAELDGSAPHDKGRTTRSLATPRPGARSPKAVAGTDQRRGTPISTAEDALRSWRRQVAARSGVPAYVVLNDAELVGVAERRPATLADLGACRGMGPIRLERWGDEILAVLDGLAT